MKLLRIALIGATIPLASGPRPASGQQPSPSPVPVATMDARDDAVRRLIGRLDLERYKASIKGLTQFGDRRQGTERNRKAVDWIEAQLKSYGCPTERIKYVYDRPPRSYRDRDFCWWLGVLGKWDMSAPPRGAEHVTIAVSGAHGGQAIGALHIDGDPPRIIKRAMVQRGDRCPAGDTVRITQPMHGLISRDRLYDLSVIPSARRKPEAGTEQSDPLAGRSALQRSAGRDFGLRQATPA